MEVDPDLFKLEPEKPEKPDTAGCIGSNVFTEALKKVEKVKAVTAKDGATWIFTIGLTHLKYKIKCNRRCGQICIFDS